jgi:hypothetical protein
MHCYCWRTAWQSGCGTPRSPDRGNGASGRRGVPQTSGNYSERGCGMPASSARTSVSRYRR